MLMEESGDNEIRGGKLEFVVVDYGGRRTRGVDFRFG